MATTALLKAQGLLSCGVTSNPTQQSANSQAHKLAIPNQFSGLRNAGPVSKRWTSQASLAQKKVRNARKGAMSVQATAAGAVGTAEKQVTEQATVRIGTRGRYVC